MVKNHGVSAIRHMVETCEYLKAKHKPLPPPGVIVQYLRDGKLLDAYYDMRNDLGEVDTKQFLIAHLSRIWETRKSNVINQEDL